MTARNDMDSHSIIDNADVRKEAHNFFFATIYANRLHLALVQRFEVDFGHGCISTRANAVDESFQRVLRDDDLIDYDGIRQLERRRWRSSYLGHCCHVR